MPDSASAGPATALYDPAANTWSAGPNLLGSPRQSARIVRLGSGKVMIVGAAGGWDFSAFAELYDPASNSLSSVPLPGRIFGPAVGLLPSGRVLVAGGS